MNMSFNLGANLKLGTSQKLTPQMQQAIRLLQMSSIELEQEVQVQLDSNPMLEREESHDDALNNSDNLTNIDSIDDNRNINIDTYPCSVSDSAPSADSDSNFSDSFDKLSEGSFDDSAVDTSWDNIYTSAPKSLAAASQTNEVDGYMGNTIANIQDHVRWQLNFKHLSNIDTMIADYLIDSMDDAGFITLDIDELFSSLSTIASFYQWEEAVDKDEIITVLKVIQSCEPLGVGARNLSECLSLQLAKLDEETEFLSEATQLLAHSEHLLTNNIDALLEATELTLDDIQPALELIRTLNPAPGQVYTDSQHDYGISPESYDIPDVLVKMMGKAQASDAGYKEDDVIWKVELNPDTLPKLKINQEYATLVKRGDESPDNIYLKENLTNAKLFLRSIEERNHNLLKVATCIIQRQEQFLLYGATAMQPMILKDVAEIVELHESTVSRLTTSKTILTPQGLFSLKHFFSSSVSGCDGEVSSTAICAMINELISNEDPKKPLSDNVITTHLKEHGIDIARRTVAKYREQLKIGSSSQRKQRY